MAITIGLLNTTNFYFTFAGGTGGTGGTSGDGGTSGGDGTSGTYGGTGGTFGDGVRVVNNLLYDSIYVNGEYIYKDTTQYITRAS